MERFLPFAMLCTFALVVVVGCTDDEATDPSAGDDGGGSAPRGEADASHATGSDAGDMPDDGSTVVMPRPKPPSDAFEDLMAYEWTLEPGQEQYYCVYKTVEEDLWITDFEPIAPPGTHHVTLGFVEDGPSDGVVEAGDDAAEFPCNGITLGDQLVYGAVVNTPGFTMPQGVAAKISAGKKLLLSVHVFNGNDDALTGRTGVAIVRADPAKVEHVAENVFAMNVGIEVTPGKSTQTSACTMEADGTILSLTHHMHLTGVRQKTTLVRKDGGRELLLDAPFVFDDQDTVILDPPVHVFEGDKLEVECDFDNPTTQTFRFGESTGENEMCLTSFYRFPAVAKSFICAK